MSDDLSRAERRVAAELATGASNGEIAARLDVTEDTIKSHVKSILRKLGCRNRSEAALQLAQRGGSEAAERLRDEILAPFLAIIEAAPHRMDCRYAIVGMGERVLIDVEELRRAVAEAEATA